MEKSGMMALETMATKKEVKITSPNDNRLIGRFIFQNSCHDVFHAAAYKIGGRKIRNTISGPRLTSGIPGIKLITKPAMTRKMG